MDPITATTTIITLATFIKDLIDVGQSIKCSIEKVRENRRRIRDLTDDILSTLSKLAALSRADECTFQAPALLSALGDLKADMLHVLSICQEISPAEPPPGFRRLKSQFKGWMKRDDVEAEIRRLKKHVNKCYIQFTAFSVARIEQTTARVAETTHRTENTTLRVEQRLIVNHVENQVTLRRVEGLMARVLVETQFGQNVMSQTIEIIASDPTHQTLEFQYLSAQAQRLVDPLHQWVTSNSLVLDTPLWEITSLVFSKSVPPGHVLHQILGVMLKISDSPAEIPFTSIQWVIDIGLHLEHLGMNSQAMAWELLAKNIFRRLAGDVPSSEILSHLAHAAKKLSHMYQHQLRWDLAIEASEEALDWCRLWQESSPDVNHGPLLGTILITHSRSLSATGQHQVAISTAEEAVVVCHAMTRKPIESSPESSSWTEVDEYNVTKLSEASFVLAKALSAIGGHLEAYQASMEGFRSVLRFSGRISAPAGAYIDDFIDQTCKLAEEDGVSLPMLADSVVLFRDLSSLYLQELPPQFLRILYAHAYLSQQNASPDTGISLRNLRLFLEPETSSPPPILEPSSNFAQYIEGFNASGGIIEDAFRAFYIYSWQTHISPLIRGIFIAQPKHAISILRRVVESSCADLAFHSNDVIWALGEIWDVIPLVSDPDQLALLRILTEIVKYSGTIIRSPLLEPWDSLFVDSLRDIVRSLWITGYLEDALVVSDTAIKYLCSCSNSEYPDAETKLRGFQGIRTCVLGDMGQIPEAVDMIQQTEKLPLSYERLYYTVQVRILRHTGRNREAIQTIRRVVSETSQTSWIVDGQAFHLHCHILLAELAAAQIHLGLIRDALQDAERAVAACRPEVADNENGQKCALVHSLTTLSNCLAAAGRDDGALEAAKEAASIYTLNAAHMWGDFLYTIRRQELGANTFHSMSLRLATFGQLEEALSNAEKATELYRELVSLVPRHRPSLAGSLRNLASTLWNVSRRDESVSACEEAVGIMRKVADTETYFLGALIEALNQLAGYLSEKGAADRAAAAKSEATEVRRKIELLPPEPDFLFSEIETEEEEEDDEEAWETATEEDDEGKNPSSRTARELQVVALEATSATNSQDTPKTCSPSEISSTEDPLHASNQLLPQPVDGAQRERHAAADRITGMLVVPLEAKSSRTPTDLLLWIWLGLLSVLVVIMGVALAVMWRRGQ